MHGCPPATDSRGLGNGGHPTLWTESEFRSDSYDWFQSKRRSGTAMLVLSRKKDQGIVIGDATIWVRKIAGDRVRIAIDAPDSIRVRRQELKPAAGSVVVDSPIQKDEP